MYYPYIDNYKRFIYLQTNEKIMMFEVELIY